MTPWFSKSIVQPVLTQKKHIISIIISLFLLSISHGFFLFLMGPLMVSLLSLAKTDQVFSLLSFVPHEIQPYASFAQGVFLTKKTVLEFLPQMIIAAGLLKSIATYFYQINHNSVSPQFNAVYTLKI